MALCCVAASLPLCFCGVGCASWIKKRCSLHGSMASKEWPEATASEFKDVGRVCRLILSVYEEDITHPQYADHLIPEQVVKRVTYADAGGKCPPYLIYVDHDAKDLALVIRGLHLLKEADYAVLMDNRKGQQKFDGGYVHKGLLRVAAWLLEKEFETLKGLLVKHKDYTLTLGGHSLGSGVAALMTIILVNSKHLLGPISPDRITCYAICPTRCTSMNLSVRYADCIKSIVLQDDFLPRTTVPLQIIFGAALCLPCLMAYSCVIDTLIPEKKKLQDPRRLYAPGRLYHIVYKRVGSFKVYPPQVRTAIPVDGRFENLVCSCNATEDHSLVQLEKKVEEATQILVREEEMAALEPPSLETMSRSYTMEDRREEHRQALKRAMSLGVQNTNRRLFDGGSEESGDEETDDELVIQGMNDDHVTTDEHTLWDRIKESFSGMRTLFGNKKALPLEVTRTELEMIAEDVKAEGKTGSKGEMRDSPGGKDNLVSPDAHVIESSETSGRKPSIYSDQPELIEEVTTGSDTTIGAPAAATIEKEGNREKPRVVVGVQSKTMSESKEERHLRKKQQKRERKVRKQKRRLAALQRAREEQLVREEKRKAEMIREAVPALTKWDKAIEELIKRNRSLKKVKTKVEKRNSWHKVRVSLPKIVSWGRKEGTQGEATGECDGETRVGAEMSGSDMVNVPAVKSSAAEIEEAEAGGTGILPAASGDSIGRLSVRKQDDPL